GDIATTSRREPRLGPVLDDEDDDDIPALPTRLVEARRPEGAGRSLIAARKARSRPGRRGATAGQATFDLVEDEEYVLPPLDLLAEAPVNKAAQRITEESLEKNARLLESVLEDFGVRG